MNIQQEHLIEKTIAYVKSVLAEAEAGHDWQHIQRVLINAEKILAAEDADEFTVKLACLLHDIADAKFHDGDEVLGPKLTQDFLTRIEVETPIIDEVVYIVKHISFKSEAVTKEQKSIEFQIVQDADRLDALGAIGVARTFHYGGYKNRSIYNAEVEPVVHQTKADYKKSTAPTINHFYEKLLLLKNKMNTVTGKKLAQSRHDFMLAYLKEFFKECGKPDWKVIENFT